MHVVLRYTTVIKVCAQGVTHFRDIRFTAGLTYGEMLLQNEYEMSCYNLDHAHVDSQRQLFTLFQQARWRTSPSSSGCRLRVPGYPSPSETLQEALERSA